MSRKGVGNYSEMFARNLGRHSPLQLDPGVNRPWNRGGIMFAPPLQ
jgi:general L-amino acid transport system substrate-binding protein